jgi:hypothetical protein
MDVNRDYGTFGRGEREVVGLKGFSAEERPTLCAFALIEGPPIKNFSTP